MTAVMFVISLTLMVLGAAGEASVQPFAHDAWGAVLETYVDEAGLVDYAGIAEDRSELDRYLEQVALISPHSHPDRFVTEREKLAYYINAYNALVFDGVLALPSDRTTVWGKTGTGAKFFVGRKYVLGGKRMSLKKLEDDIVRKEFGDPRIHAALNCASRGCPRLPREPFLPSQLDEQLEAAMTEFLNDERNCSYEKATGTIYLSKIFDWFRSDFEDFEGSQGRAPSLLSFVNRYRSDPFPGGAKIQFSKYDKRLNRQAASE